MSRLNQLLCLTVSLASISTFAQPIKVRLDTVKELVAYHTPALLFGLRFASGKIIGAGLFTDADLRAGVLEKMIEVDPTDKIENCEYEWLVTADSVPGTSTHPLGKISMPLGFDGDLRKKCEVDLSKGEILLSIAPFKLEKLEVYIASDSLINRKAKSAAAIVTPRGEQTDKYRNFSLPFNESMTFPRAKITYLLAREPLLYKLQTAWMLKAGGVEKDEREYKENFIEIK